jgi:hypothetical protein
MEQLLQPTVDLDMRYPRIEAPWITTLFKGPYRKICVYTTRKLVEQILIEGCVRNQVVADCASRSAFSHLPFHSLIHQHVVILSQCYVGGSQILG